MRQAALAGITWAAAFLQPSAGLTDASTLRPWIPRMRIRKAHGGSLEQLTRQHRVVVAMTTIPPRIQHLDPVLDAMLTQTWPVAAIHLSIPFVYNRTGERYVIPPWLASKVGVHISRCEDLGPGTHLLNALRLERDPWTFIVVVDDDHIYSHDLVETLMRAAFAHPGSAVAAQGFLSIPGLKLDRDSPRYLHDQGFAAGPVLVSYLGVVYQRGFFDNSVFDYSNIAAQCKYQDDMWFSAHLAQKGIRRAVLGAALGVQELEDLHLGPSSLTFWEENKPRQVSMDCDKSLKLRDADVWTWRRRVVLALGGLPRMQAQGVYSLEGLSGNLALEELEMWRVVINAIRSLPRVPDLTYLCTEVQGFRRQQGSLGISFRLDGLLVTASDACPAYLEEARVSQLLRDPLQWEGDPNTIIVVSTLRDLLTQGPDVQGVTACAAEQYSSDEEAGQLAGIQGQPSGHPRSPWCRTREVAAISVGAFEEAFGGGQRDET